MSVPYITSLYTYKNGNLTTSEFMEPEEYSSTCIQELTDASGEAFAIKAADYNSSTASGKINTIYKNGVNYKVISAWHPMKDDTNLSLPYNWIRWYGTTEKSLASLTYSVVVDTDGYRGNRFFHEIKFTVHPTFEVVNSTQLTAWSYEWSGTCENFNFGPSGTNWGLELSYSVSASWAPGSQAHPSETHVISCTFSLRTTGQGSDAEVVTVSRNYYSEEGLVTHFEPFTFTALYTDTAYLS